MKKLSVIIALAFSLNVSAQITIDSLIGWYPFDGNANDESIYDNNGTVNGATLTTDRFGNVDASYEFEGVDDNVVIYPTTAYLDLTNYDSLSISVWFNKYSNNELNTDIFDLRDLSNNNSIGLVVQFDTLYSGDFLNPGNNESWSIKIPLTNYVNEWTHVVIAIDHLNNETDIYMNGTLASTVDSVYVSWPANNRLTIGSRFDYFGSQCCFWDGKIDDIRFYNTVLGQSEVTLLFNEGLCFETIYDTITTTIYDTTFVTITDTNYITISDTTFITVTDTNFVTITDTSFITINDTNIVTITDTNYVTISDTNFITITDTTYLSVIDTLIIDFTTNIPGPNTPNTILIYPNPTSDQVIIDNGDLSTVVGYQIKIENALGQQMFQSIINQQQFVIDLNTWTGNGIYFVHIIDDIGNTVLIRKIVLQ